MSSYFYSQAQKNITNAAFIGTLETFSDRNQVLLYVLDKPLTDQKYAYSYKQAVIVLAPKHRITLVNCGKSIDKFDDYVEDVIEDIASISDKYQYKEIIGRPRQWRDKLIHVVSKPEEIPTPAKLFADTTLNSEEDSKRVELLISLFIGSINDVDRVKADVPQTVLDKVKQKIQLFDGDQTRFIYQTLRKKRITIQGLSGTGKTELLLHKLKDLYTTDNTSRIFFTCFNRVLADSLRKRIPAFFNFMKVEQQIEWKDRLWCTHAWGSYSDPHSGAYRFICSFYDVEFYTLREKNFPAACETTAKAIEEKYKGKKVPPAFTYMFIDESQDFNEAFFKLCELVTEKYLYVAGDIFQTIFDERISPIIKPDFLLGKCYRTDPKTLMFAHALGMGLFETSKLRWLDKKEWGDCGYNVDVRPEGNQNKFYLTREPLRRFEDLDSNFESMTMVPLEKSIPTTVVKIIQNIRKEHQTVQPDDIGIILLDADKDIFTQADLIEAQLSKSFKWDVNKAYETKEKKTGTIFLSNRNNVKGLEFPFVICITKKILASAGYRNSIYTMLTRSFIKSYLVAPDDPNEGLTDTMKSGLAEIVQNGRMVITEPSAAEKNIIRTRFQYELQKKSHYDLMQGIFQSLNVERMYHENLLQMSHSLIDADELTLNEFVKANLKFVKNSSSL